jgi:hypothetical protein
VSRLQVSPRLRFEVFKRDKFTCQYCGARAPDVLLQADHIKPVAEGGTNDILNLLTSCSTCNGGKGAIPLSDAQALNKQRDVLEDLEERRQQIEMMVRWRDELQGIHSDAVEALAARIAERGKFDLNETGKADIRRWLNRFNVGELLEAIDDAFNIHLQYENDEPTEKSLNLAFSKIPGRADIIRQEQEKPYLRRLLYIQGIIRKRAKAPRYNCIDYLEHVHLCGVELDDLERRARGMSSLEDFEGPLDAWLERIGRAF